MPGHSRGFLPLESVRTAPPAPQPFPPPNRSLHPTVHARAFPVFSALASRGRGLSGRRRPAVLRSGRRQVLHRRRDQVAGENAHGHSRTQPDTACRYVLSLPF